VRVRAAVLRSFRQAFTIEDVDLPDPGPGSAIVDVRAVGVCGRDLVVWRGGFRGLKPPLILGHEVFGEYEGKPMAVFPAIVGGVAWNIWRSVRTFAEITLFSDKPCPEAMRSTSMCLDGTS